MCQLSTRNCKQAAGAVPMQTVSTVQCFASLLSMTNGQQAAGDVPVYVYCPSLLDSLTQFNS